ncbi:MULTISPECIES: ABC transporter ATP-binding protein [unclassified Xanthobacter]|uniref:ABC transporter ATP-binding protein n=1 Tax=unclassified Xanthobacter TaxID=2623496 RepID=UPI001EE0EA19|nr:MULTISPECIES: ABC transporter ATP-binding protein [unclassified Xanthobacter]
MAALELRHLNAFYGKAHILQGVDLALEPGTVVGVIGRNGAGKTTLLRAIMGLQARVEGELELFGAPLTGLAADARARAGLALMSQDMRVFPELTVEENCRAAAATVREPLPLEQVLEVIPELKPHWRRAAGRLSGGQQQLVAIARNLTVRCRVLMLDEPTEGLMPSIVTRIGEIVRRLAESQVAVLLVEQNVELTFAISTRIHILEKGRFVAEGTPREIVSGGLLERYLGVSDAPH